ESTGHVPSNGSANISGTSNYLIDRDQDTRNLSVDYRIDTDAEWLEAQVMAWRNEVDMTESRLSDSRRDHTGLDTTGININNLSRIGKVELLYGVDGYREDFST